LARVSTTVAEIMDRDPVTVRESDTVETVVRLLHEQQARGLPVIGDGDKVVGIVTENDLLLYDEQEDIDPPPHLQIMGGIIFLGSVKHWEERVRKSIAATVGDLMTRDPVTVGPDATAHEAGRLIAEHRHNRLPVVDGDGRLLGVVTRVDVLEALLDER
jgi:CBS domain-containing protein